MPYLDVGDGHQLHYEIQGKLSAGDNSCPVLFVHGGPGAGVKQTDKKLLGATRRPVIFLDQRGSGKSRYSDLLTANSTEYLLQDIEQLRLQLGVDRFVLVGGSWGSTLSLLYAIRHPQCVERLLLWGIFLCRQQELDWFYRHGANVLYPDEFEAFSAVANNSADLITAYYELLTSGCEAQQRHAAAAWARWEAVNSFLAPDEKTLANFSQPDTALTMATLESYFFKNRAFIPQDFILKNISKLGSAPLDIVQGRYDTICPCLSAWLLHKAYPKSQLQISHLAAHDATERQNTAAITGLLAQL